MTTRTIPSREVVAGVVPAGMIDHCMDVLKTAAASTKDDGMVRLTRDEIPAAGALWRAGFLTSGPAFHYALTDASSPFPGGAL